MILNNKGESLVEILMSLVIFLFVISTVSFIVANSLSMIDGSNVSNQNLFAEMNSIDTDNVANASDITPSLSISYTVVGGNEPTSAYTYPFTTDYSTAYITPSNFVIVRP